MEFESCGYFRVSSADTAENKLAVKKYRQMLSREGVKPKNIFYDFSSGGNTKRQDYQKMLSAISKGEYNLVVVPIQSRLNRSVLNSALLINHLAENNAKLKICGSSKIIDPKNPTDKLFYHLNAIFDESKLAEASANSRSNHEYLRSNKMVSSVPFGYTIYRGKPKLDTEPYLCVISEKNAKRKKEISLESKVDNTFNFFDSPVLKSEDAPHFERTTAEILRELIDTILEKQSIPAAIKLMMARYGIPQFISGQRRHREQIQFNFKCDPLFEHRKQMKFSLFGVKNLIDNPLLQGDLCYFRLDSERDTIIYHDAYPECAIVTRLEFRQLQALRTRPWKVVNQRDRFPYAGLIYCHHCASRLKSRNGWKRKDGVRHKSYYCPNRPQGCLGKSIRQEVIEDYVTRKLVLRHQQIALIASDNPSSTESPQIKQLRQQLAQLEQIGQNQAIIKAIADIKKQIAQKQKEELLGEKNKEDNLATLEAVFADPLYWETLSNSEKWQINHLLIERIEIGVVEKKSQVAKLKLLL